MTSDHKVYKLSSFKDVFDNVPSDKVELCLSEIAGSIKLAQNACDMTRILFPVLKDSKNSEVFTYPDVTDWIDDDKGLVGFKLLDEKGEVGLDIQLKKNN